LLLVVAAPSRIQSASSRLGSKPQKRTLTLVQPPFLGSAIVHQNTASRQICLFLRYFDAMQHLANTFDTYDFIGKTGWCAIMHKGWALAALSACTEQAHTKKYAIFHKEGGCILMTNA
jgi:hypothetical protein